MRHLRNPSANLAGNHSAPFRIQAAVASTGTRYVWFLHNTAQAIIFPWRRIRPSHGRFSRPKLGMWFPCHGSAAFITATNAAPPDLQALKSLLQ